MNPGVVLLQRKFMQMSTNNISRGILLCIFYDPSCFAAKYIPECHKAQIRESGKIKIRKLMPITLEITLIV